MYEFRETGLRTVDDFGIVGASIDAARIQGNKGTVHGRLGNFISGPALKYGAETPGGVEEITIGLAEQLKKADRVGMVADDFTVYCISTRSAAYHFHLYSLRLHPQCFHHPPHPPVPHEPPA